MDSFDDQVQAAVQAHSAWKLRLRQAIASGKSDLKVETVLHHDQCAFAKWLYDGAPPSRPSTSDYDEVRMVHAEFHREAARVLSLAISGQPAMASNAMELGSPFSRASAQLVTALTRLRAFDSEAA
ncbi:MAG TPA: CZB domain-containing protein [Tepidiformaceae bacterium]|jgi:hypothetical protein